MFLSGYLQHKHLMSSHSGWLGIWVGIFHHLRSHHPISPPGPSWVMRVVDYRLPGSLMRFPAEKMLQGFVSLAVAKNHWTVVNTNQHQLWRSPKSKFWLSAIGQFVFFWLENVPIWKIQKVSVFFPCAGVKEFFCWCWLFFIWLRNETTLRSYIHVLFFGILWQKSWQNRWVTWLVISEA